MLMSVTMMSNSLSLDRMSTASTPSSAKINSYLPARMSLHILLRIKGLRSGASSTNSILLTTIALLLAESNRQSSFGNILVNV